ncbi:transcriptional regulator [Chromatiales bacterium (ex Bugula neritina AB1)]|nr:transcriptional regulator [Chromatiales bacterium (ex Bugula neritina AB1)]
MANQLVFSALADPTRRHIFEGLRSGPRTVSEISSVQPVSRPAVSQHLKVLQQAGLVQVEPRGTRRFYFIRREGLAELRTYLDSFWSDVLSAYSAEIHRNSGDN